MGLRCLSTSATQVNKNVGQQKMFVSIKCWTARNVYTQYSRGQVQSVYSWWEKKTEWRHTSKHAFKIRQPCRDMNKFLQMTIMVYLKIVTHQEMIISCIGHTKIFIFSKLVYIYTCVCVWHDVSNHSARWCSDGSLGLSEVSVDLQDLQMDDTKCTFRIPRLNRRLYSCFPWGIT